MLSPLPQFQFDDQTWIISENRYCGRPDGWQETIIENWNRLIQAGEIVFHVGDLARGKRKAFNP
jgi:calcineurin-like phosphoesterase family protein